MKYAIKLYKEKDDCIIQYLLVNLWVPKQVVLEYSIL